MGFRAIPVLGALHDLAQEAGDGAEPGLLAGKLDDGGAVKMTPMQQVAHEDRLAPFVVIEVGGDGGGRQREKQCGREAEHGKEQRQRQDEDAQGDIGRAAHKLWLETVDQHRLVEMVMVEHRLLVGFQFNLSPQLELRPAHRGANAEAVKEIGSAR